MLRIALQAVPVPPNEIESQLKTLESRNDFLQERTDYYADQKIQQELERKQLELQIAGVTNMNTDAKEALETYEKIQKEKCIGDLKCLASEFRNVAWGKVKPWETDKE